MITHSIFGMVGGFDKCDGCGARHPIWSAVNGIPEDLSIPVMRCESQITFNRILVDLVSSHDPEFLSSVRFHFTDLPSGCNWRDTLHSFEPTLPESVTSMYTILHKPTHGASH